MISFIFVKSSHVPASFPVNFHLYLCSKISICKVECRPQLSYASGQKIHRGFVVLVLFFVLFLFLKNFNSMISKEKIHGR